MKTISEATPQEILDRIEILDRWFWAVSPAERPIYAEAISTLIKAHRAKVDGKRENTPFTLIDVTKEVK